MPFALAPDLTQILIVVLGGSGISAVAALLRFKPDRDAVIVSAAQGALVVQSGVIDALQEEVDRARATVEAERLARANAESALLKAHDRIRKLELQLAGTQRSRRST